MPTSFTYHGVDGPTHQRHVDELWPQGYRPISLSVSGDPANSRYAAGWLHRAGVEWVALHGVDERGFLAKRAELAPRQLVPTIVTATGPPGRATFAAVFEKIPVRDWYSEHALHWGGENQLGTINKAMVEHAAEGMVPLFITAHGDPQDMRFACTWVAVDEARSWSWWRVGAGAYQKWFKALLRAGTRPVWVTPTPSGDYVAIFADQPWGEYLVEHGMDDAAYRATYRRHVDAGFYLHQVQSSGVGAGTRYAAIFVRDDALFRRSWAVTGRAHPVFTEIDALVKGFMQGHGIRAGSVAVARKGTLLIDHGYTWAEPGYPTTQPDALFRLASVSKLFTAAAVDTLVQAGRLTWSTTAFPYLGITTPRLPTQTPAANINTVTLAQLAMHTSGMQRDYGKDPQGADYRPRSIAAALGLAWPPSNDDITSFMYGQPLQALSPNQTSYSNTAFNVLTSVVERASGQPFVTYLKGTVLRQLIGLGPIHGAVTAAGFRWPGEVATYDDPRAGESQLDMSPGAVDAFAYGGQWALESVEGSGGLVASSATVARTIGLHAVWGYGGRGAATRHGDFEGTCAGAISHRMGLDVGYAFNRLVSGADHDALSAALREVLDRRTGEL